MPSVETVWYDKEDDNIFIVNACFDLYFTDFLMENLLEGNEYLGVF